MLLSSTDPLGNTTTNVYDSNHNLISVTDPLGNVNTYTYDANGNKTSSIYPATPTNSNITSTTQYNQYSEPTSTIDELGNVRVFNYDANFNPQSVTDGIGTLASFQFNANQTFAAGAIGFDITVNSANASQFTYDGNGNLIGRTDALGRTTSYTYDSLGQKLTLTTPTPTAPTGSSASTTNYSYDQLGNLLLTAAPLSRTTSSTYDGNSNKISDTDARGNVTGYQYDSLNRLIETDYPDGTKATKTYDFRNNVIRETDQNGNVTLHAYDLSGRQVSVTRGYGTASASATTYAYDNAGRKTSNHVKGVSPTYTYDSLNRLSAVADANLAAGANTTSYAYDPASNLTTATYPSGVQSVMTYDALNRITGLATQNSGFLYQRGPTGNLTYATELNGRTINWSYDGIYRLTNESISADPSKNNGSSSYTLDPVGNRLAESTTLPGLSSGSFGYNTDDEVNTETYDANGNTLATGGKIFTYDSDNHLMTMNGGAVTIVYDGDGNRVAKTVGGVTTQYLVDDLNPTGYAQVVEELVGGSVTRQFTFGLQRISQNQLISDAWTVSFYGYDGGGNVRNLTNTTGAITDEYEYDAFGNAFTKVGSTPNVYLYRGEQYDSDLALYYLRARYYDPLTGRFLSRDPNVGYIDEPATLHKYLYAGGDPVNRVDPSGRADTIETIFTVTVVSSPLEIAAEEVGLALTKAFCYIAKTVARATLGVPPGMSHVPGPPGWPGLSAAACRALGF